MNTVEARTFLPFPAVAFVQAETVSCELNDFLAAKLYVFPRIHVQIQMRSRLINVRLTPL
jgi:hypothetical protein